MTPFSNDFVPLYAQIQRFLRGEIAAGRLGEGDRVASEPELAQRFSTTRATVARALQTLVFEGAIVRRPGIGTFVAERTVTAPIDLTRVLSFEDQVTARGASIDYELVRFQKCPPQDGEGDRLQLPDGGQVYRLDRVRIVGGRRMSLERRVIPEELGRAITLDMLARLSLHRILDEVFGLKVRRVEGEIRAATANTTTAQILSVKRGTPLLIRDYVLFSADRRALLTGESYYTSDFRIAYVVQQDA